MPPFSHLYLTHIILFLLTIAITSGCQQQAPPSQTSIVDTPPPQLEGTIVAMGNSLTAGFGVAEDNAYPALLARKLQANGYPFQVINAGISGETSSGALSRTQWTLTLKPTIVILETGANDGLRGISPELTQQNIEAIVKQFQLQQVVVLLAGMRIVENLGDHYTSAFANIYPNVANAHNLLLMPFFLEGVAGKPHLNQADGIHPTAEGYGDIVTTLYPYVTAAIKRSRAQSRTDQ